jgi:hypothetical protein
MPMNFYTKDFGSVDGRPLVRMVFLDTSAPRESLQQQIDLLDQAFQAPGPAPVWRIAASITRCAMRANMVKSRT